MDEGGESAAMNPPPGDEALGDPDEVAYLGFIVTQKKMVHVLFGADGIAYSHSELKEFVERNITDMSLEPYTLACKVQVKGGGFRARGETGVAAGPALLQGMRSCGAGPGH